ncbi:MAG: SpoIIE family protein phosphatase [Planctomycetia bacterium]|nr:SpoIIE family protein phosphatase [Planctomycetia bacterium]
MRTIILIGQDDDFTQQAEEAISGGDFAIRRFPRAEDVFADDAQGGADVVCLAFAGDDKAAWEQVLTVSRRFAHSSVPVAAYTEGLDTKSRVRLFDLGFKDCLSPEMHPEELAARMQSLVETKMKMDSLRDENLRVVLASRGLEARVEQTDKQLRLARRLQQDFLPKSLPELPGVRFAARMEPAGWVAGDFYDIFRLDEAHVGFYVADVAGHNMASALLTIFVKKSLQTKRIQPGGYELVMPDEAMRLLNADLISAQLEAVSYITLIYGIYNMHERRLQYARAGHPKPFHIGPDGNVTHLDADGPLLGIFADAEFELRDAAVGPDDRVLFYTDGVERCQFEDLAEMAAFEALVSDTAPLPLDDAVAKILDTVQRSPVEKGLEDDVTLLAFEAGDDARE